MLVKVVGMRLLIFLRIYFINLVFLLDKKKRTDLECLFGIDDGGNIIMMWGLFVF